MKKILLSLMLFLFLAPSAFAIDLGTSSGKKEEVKNLIQTRKDEVREKVNEKRESALKAKLEKEINRRIAALEKIAERTSRIKRINQNQKDTLLSQIQVEIKKLEDLKTQVANETDNEKLKTLSRSVVRDYRIFALFIPKIHIIAASDSLENATDQLNVLIKKYEDKAKEAEAAGKDVKELNKIIADLKLESDSAKKQAQDARNLVLPLTPEGYPDNKEILKDARKLLQDGHKDLQDSRHLIISIIREFKDIDIEINESSKSASPLRYRQNQ